MVHGPLNLISILDLWRDVAAKGSEDPAVFLPEKVEYRATSPLYVGDEYRIVLEENGSGNGGKVQILDPQGTVGMKADITGSA